MKEPKRIFLYCDNLLGDFLMQTAALRGLRAKYPNAEVVYCTKDDSVSKPLVENCPAVDKVMTEMMGRMLREKGDLWLNPSCVHAHSWAATHGCNMTEAQCHLWDVPCDGLHYSLNVPDKAMEDAGQLIHAHNWRNIVVCGRHSSSCASNDARQNLPPNKCFPNREWVKVAQWLIDNGYMPLAVGSERDAEDERYREWPGATLYGEDIMTIAAIQKLAALTISVDTGIRHMAAAVGGNLYTISGATHTSVVGCHPIPGAVSDWSRKEQKIVERIIPPSLVRGEDLIEDLQNNFKIEE